MAHQHDTAPRPLLPSPPVNRGAVFTLALLLLLLLSAASTSQQEDASGSWQKKNFAASGTWTLDAAARTLTLSSDFATKDAPDLKLFLSPLGVGEVNNSNATQGAVLIAALRSHRGAQTYRLPDGVDLGDFRSLLIHCERYSKLWAATELRSPRPSDP